MKHPYADILIAIAEGKEIQELSAKGEWFTCCSHYALHDIAEENSTPERYRVKPATILINGVECGAPVEKRNGYDWVIVRKNDAEKVVHFGTPEARDAAYAALIKPFGEQV